MQLPQPQMDDPETLVAGAYIPAPGDLIADKYRVECVLAKTDQSAVLAAHDEMLDRPVALKVLPSIREQTRVARFLREARTVAKLESDHVVKILDVGTLRETGAPYLVLERLDGLDLGKLVDRDGALSRERAIDYVLQACEALAHAHREGIVHRDVKPQNLFLCRRADGTSLVKVVDFGIAKAQDRGEEEPTLTANGMLLGSPAYMSPEQIQLPNTVDARSDVWSLGVVLYRLLSGEAPFGGAILADIVRNVLTANPPPPRGVDPVLAGVVMKCLRRDVRERFSSVLSLARALEPFGTRETARDMIARIAFVAGERRAGAAVPSAAGSGSAPVLVMNDTTGPSMIRSAPPPPQRGSWGPKIAATGAALAVLGLLVIIVVVKARTPTADAAPSPAATTPAALPTPTQTASSEEPPPAPAPTPTPETSSSTAVALPTTTATATPKPPPPRTFRAPSPPPVKTAAPAPAPSSSLPKVLGGRI